MRFLLRLAEILPPVASRRNLNERGFVASSENLIEIYPNLSPAASRNSRHLLLGLLLPASHLNQPVLQAIDFPLQLCRFLLLLLPPQPREAIRLIDNFSAKHYTAAHQLSHLGRAMSGIRQKSSGDVLRQGGETQPRRAQELSKKFTDL